MDLYRVRRRDDRGTIGGGAGTGCHRFDTPAQTIRTFSVALMIGDEPGDYCCGRSVKVGPGRGGSRCDCSVFPGRFPNPACTFQCTGLSTKPGQAAVLMSSSVSGQGEGMTAPR
jgi:hypothetical protein